MHDSEQDNRLPMGIWKLNDPPVSYQRFKNWWPTLSLLWPLIRYAIKVFLYIVHYFFGLLKVYGLLDLINCRPLSTLGSLEWRIAWPSEVLRQSLNSDPRRQKLHLDTKVYKGDRFNRESILDVLTHFKLTETFRCYSCQPLGVTKGVIEGGASSPSRDKFLSVYFWGKHEKFQNRPAE